MLPIRLVASTGTVDHALTFALFLPTDPTNSKDWYRRWKEQKNHIRWGAAWGRLLETTIGNFRDDVTCRRTMIDKASSWGSESSSSSSSSAYHVSGVCEWYSPLDFFWWSPMAPELYEDDISILSANYHINPKPYCLCSQHLCFRWQTKWCKGSKRLPSCSSGEASLI